MPEQRARGFTLVEVLVALAVVALSLPALLFALDQQVDGTAYLRDKSLARLVASNKLTEVRLLAGARGQLLRGSESGEERLAGRDWYWWLDSSSTEVPGFNRITVRVSLSPGDDANSLVTLVGYLDDPGGGDEPAP
ncbi:type II secretion system minor pseudopilin GspI [Pseudohaliea rubra]|uniref:Type II secretion system protein I n=1 Tax=Pseudohaliea rubra DSM 19751 TaxID=1265313 RepID=A0A095X3A4_9GAMM|nr:type II secretion system minor pseudopilin GspI [Pseudohaliea rubra]KGE05374.1 General secretion pathway protein I [Pseudohaliea rubra DSM 19751]